MPLPRSVVIEKLQAAMVSMQQGKAREARDVLEKILQQEGDDVDVLHLLGLVAGQEGRSQEAEALFARAISVNPGFAAAHSNRGNALRALGRLDDALACLDHAIALKPGHAVAHANRAVVLGDLDRNDEALASYDVALSIDQEYAEAHFGRGVTLLKLDRFAEALENFDRVLALKPGHAAAHCNRGTALVKLQRMDDALIAYARAIALAPDSPEVIALKDYAEAFYNRGNARLMEGRHAEALADYEAAFALKPEQDFLLGALLHSRMLVCAWDGFDQSRDELQRRLRNGERVASPLIALGLYDAPELHMAAAKIWVEARCPEQPPSRSPQQAPRTDNRIRLGYYSADFHNHATMRLMAEVFEQHDKAAFELIAFSFGPDADDTMRKRALSAFDRFLDIRGLSDAEAAKRSQDLGIDIAVDLKGFTGDSRPGIFAARAAPVQVNYLGYPGTMGAGYIDYIIADKTTILPEHEQHFTEKIVRLPHSFQPQDGGRKIAERALTRAEYGLPLAAFVFCCFNNISKILPATFDIWMRLLGQVEGSVLWLLEDSAIAARNLRKEAAARAIGEDRLVFARRVGPSEHLARHRLADLFLDTLPYNAHTTASDALWAGLPVLTPIGEAFAGRVAASLLKAAGLPELIATTAGEYETRALNLARVPGKLQVIRQRLASNARSMPLFDAPLYVRGLEHAYRLMFERSKAGLPPCGLSLDEAEASP